MQNTSSKKDGEERVLMDALSSYGPVAKGSLSQVRMKSVAEPLCQPSEFLHPAVQ